MTVTSTVATISYAGNGSTRVFAVPYYFLEASHLLVRRITTATSAIVTLMLGPDYSVQGAGDPAGGSVTISEEPPAAGTVLRIDRAVPLTQETDYVPNDPFPADSHEMALDKLTMIAQGTGLFVGDSLGRALRVPIGETLADMPSAANRSTGGAIGFAPGLPSAPILMPFTGTVHIENTESLLPLGPAFGAIDFTGAVSSHVAVQNWFTELVENNRMGFAPPGIIRLDQPVTHTLDATLRHFGFVGSGMGTVFLVSASNHQGGFLITRTGSNPRHSIRLAHFKIEPEGPDCGTAFRFNLTGGSGSFAGTRYRTAIVDDVWVSSGSNSARWFDKDGLDFSGNHHPLFKDCWVEGTIQAGNALTNPLWSKAPVTFDAVAAVDPATDVFTIANHPFRNGSAVVYSVGPNNLATDEVGGLQHAATYIVGSVVRGVSFKLYESTTKAKEATTPIAITADGIGGGHYFLEEDFSETSNRYKMSCGFRVDYCTHAVFERCLSNSSRLAYSNYGIGHEGLTVDATASNNVRTGFLVDRDGNSPVIHFTHWHAHYVDEGAILAGPASGIIDFGTPSIQGGPAIYTPRDLYIPRAAGLDIRDLSHAGPGAFGRVLYDFDQDLARPAQAQNLVRNGAMCENAFWTVTAPWTINTIFTDRAEIDGSQTGNVDLTQSLADRMGWFTPTAPVATEAARLKVRLMFDWTWSAGVLTVIISGTAGLTIAGPAASGSYDQTITLPLAGGTDFNLVFRADLNFAGSVTNVWAGDARNIPNSDISNVRLDRIDADQCDKLVVVRNAANSINRITMSHVNLGTGAILTIPPAAMITDPNDIVRIGTSLQDRHQLITSEADVTLRLYEHANTQIVTATLTSAMAITLSPEFATNGAMFTIIRQGTGAFNITVTGGGILTAAGKGCRTMWLAGAWTLIETFTA